uniref:SCAN box domain-containing protein n=1 Tax=Cyprinus carpio TaxID=7962 RepID=A0A8C1Z3T0_CYPCA
MAKEDWAIRLIPLLTGKARSAYVAMDVVDAREYEHVKEAILAKYSINQETYRQQLRALEVLEDVYQKWVRPAGKTKQKIGEMIVLEQFLILNTDEADNICFYVDTIHRIGCVLNVYLQGESLESCAGQPGTQRKGYSSGRIFDIC